MARPTRPDRTERRRAQRRQRRLAGLGTVAVAVIVCCTLLAQANGTGGALAADALRAVIGPAATARIEVAYLGLSDTLRYARYHLDAQGVRAPWMVAVTAHPPRPRVAPTLQAHTLRPMRLPPLPPIVTPALPDEGLWTTAGLPGPAPGPVALPPIAKAFIRPDAARPYALVTLLQVDLRVARLHIVAGTAQPGGPRGLAGAGVIPGVNWHQDRLLAAFNGGFKYADGAYGLMTGGTVYVPPVWGAATVALTSAGHVIMGSWGLDRRLTGANGGLTAWRQNGALLIDHGRIAPLTQDGAAWGLTILNRAYTWRSGIGLTRQGTLLYAAGDALSAATLAQALRAAGAVTALQLDINPFWVRAFTYGQNAAGQLVAAPLNPGMYGTGREYVTGDARDFFYMTRP